jgi:acetyltransferase-like isoleucine patch superfamily enzyme
VCQKPFAHVKNHFLLRKIRKQRAIFFSQIACAIKQYRLKRNCIRIGHKVRVAPGFKCLSNNLVIGNHVHLNDAYIDSTSLVTIGDYTFFGPGVRILTATHDITKLGLERQQTITSKPISIGQGVFLAADATIIGGTCIGDNAVIGARSVVTKDVLPNSFAAGNPARTVRTLVT